MAGGIQDFSRDTDAAIRLYMIHSIAKHEMGFLLHPAIPQSKSTHFQVLDIACGSCVWLTESAAAFPGAWFHGFDLSGAHFPQQDELPRNVKLWQQDASEAVPAEQHAQYDVVHVARLHLYLGEEKLAVLVENCRKLLKPGGFLQWDEVDTLGMHAARWHGREFPAFEEMHKHANEMLLAAQSGSNMSLDAIPDLLKQHSFQVLESKRWEVSKAMSKPWTDMQLIANRDYLEHVAIPYARSKGDEAAGTIIEHYRGLKQSVEREVREGGLRILMDLLFTVARREETNS